MYSHLYFSLNQSLIAVSKVACESKTCVDIYYLLMQTNVHSF